MKESSQTSNINAISEIYIKSPKEVGKAKLEFLFWNIYEATLVADNGKYAESGPFLLSLTYLKNFEGEAIARRSIDEMRNLGAKEDNLETWYPKMVALFPNVKKGEQIIGVFDSNNHTHFYYEGVKIGTIEDKSYGRAFFDIWLSSNSSQPKMRNQLLGLTEQ